MASYCNLTDSGSGSSSASLMYYLMFGEDASSSSFSSSGSSGGLFGHLADGGMSTSIVIGIFTFVAFFTAFLLARYFVPALYFPRFYFPEYYPKKKKEDSSDEDEEVEHFSLKAPLLRSHASELEHIARNGRWIDWMKAVYRYSLEDIKKNYGEDAYIFFYFLAKLRNLALFVAVIVMLISLPINATGENPGLGVERITITSIANDSNRLWGHLIVVAIISGAVLYTIESIWKHFISQYQEYRLKNKSCNYTLMLRELPVPAEIQNDDTFKAYCERMFYPFKVLNARLYYYCPLLSSLVISEKLLKLEIQKAEDITQNTGTEPTVLVKDESKAIWNAPVAFKKAPAREYYTSRLADVRSNIEEQRALLQESLIQHKKDDHGSFRIKTKPIKMLADVGLKVQSTVTKEAATVVREVGDALLPKFWQKSRATKFGFVTFDSPKAIHIFRQTLTTVDSSKVVPKIAPEPEAVNWDVLHIDKRHRFLRRLGILAASIFLVLFWSVVVALFASLFNYSLLAAYVPKLAEFICKLRSPLNSLIIAYLPTLATTIMVFLLIPILRVFVGLEAHSDLGQEDRSLFRKYFAFLLFNVLFSVSITPEIPSIYNELQTITTPCYADNVTTTTELFFLDAVSGVSGSGEEGVRINNYLACAFLFIAETLGNAIPTSGFFFVNYTINAIGLTLALSFLRIGTFVTNRIKVWFVAKSSYDKDQSYLPGNFLYPIAYATSLSFFSLGLTFSVILPLLPVLVYLYLVCFSFMYKHNVLAVFQQTYQLGGQLITTSFPIFLTVLLVYQVTMLGVFLCYHSIGTALAMLIIICITIAYYLNLHNKYNVPARYLSLFCLSQESNQQPPNDMDAYLQPEFRNANDDEFKVTSLESPLDSPHKIKEVNEIEINIDVDSHDNTNEITEESKAQNVGDNANSASQTVEEEAVQPNATSIIVE